MYRRGFLLGVGSLSALPHLSFAAEVLSRSSYQPLGNSEVIALVRERIDARQAVGMVIGILDDAGHRIIPAGRMAANDSRPVAADTVFGIASVTKAFVALLLADAVTREEIDLEADASSYLPVGTKLPERAGRKIKVIDLATHTSGLPHDLPRELVAEIRDADKTTAKEAMYRQLASYELPEAPGAAWSYSNLGYALLTHILEARTGLSYSHLVNTRITDVLGMHSTGTEITTEMSGRRATPHLPSLDPSPEWKKPWMPAVLQSTATDLLTFISGAMGKKPSALQRSFATMLQVDRPAPALNGRQALGWHVYPFNGQPLIGHTGGGGGFAATVLFDPNAKTGVALLSNAELIQHDLAQHILRSTLPLNQIKKELVLDAKALEKFVGDYLDDSGAMTRIRLDGHQLVLHMPVGHKAPLTPEGETQFFVRGFAGLSAAFERSEDGQFRTLHWTLNGKTITAARQP